MSSVIMYNVFDYYVYNVFGRIPCVRHEADTALTQAPVFGFRTVFFFLFLSGSMFYYICNFYQRKRNGAKLVHQEKR